MKEKNNIQKNNETENEISTERLSEHTFGAYLGIKIEELMKSKAVLSLEIEQRHLNINKILHGGVAMSLADVAMGMSCSYLDEVIATTHLHYHFLKPVTAGKKIIAKGEIVKLGSKLISCETKLYIDNEIIGMATADFFRMKSE